MLWRILIHYTITKFSMAEKLILMWTKLLTIDLIVFFLNRNVEIQFHAVKWFWPTGEGGCREVSPHWKTIYQSKLAKLQVPKGWLQIVNWVTSWNIGDENYLVVFWRLWGPDFTHVMKQQIITIDVRDI